MSANAPTADLFRTERMRRRRIVNAFVEIGATVAALLAVGVLVIVVGSVIKRGWGAINVDFFTKTPALYSGFGPRPESGIENAIIGTLIIIGLALLMALPVAVLTAIYLNELAPRKLAGVVTLAFDVLNGIPAIVLGIFVFVFVVVGHGQAAWKASFALAILMVPMIARSTQEVLALVPTSMREASLALGAAKWRTTLSVVLPRPWAESSPERRSRRLARPARQLRSSSRPRSTATPSTSTRRTPSPRSRCSSSPPPSRRIPSSNSRPGVRRPCSSG